MKIRKQGPYIYKPWLQIGLAFGFGVFALVMMLIYRQSELWISVSLGILLIVCLYGAADSVYSRLELREDALVVRALFSRKVMPKDQIKHVGWEYGCGVTIQFEDGHYDALADFGNAQSVSNAIRAWHHKE